MVEVNAFLREAFHYKVGVFVAIRFDVKNPAIVYDFVAFQHIYKLIHIPFFEHIKLSFTCFSPFLLLIKWKGLNIPISSFVVWFRLCRNCG